MTALSGWRRLRQLAFGKASLWSLLPILVALIGSGALNISYTRSLAETREQVAHSLRVNAAINDLLSTLQDIETGQRGYIITGNPSYLTPYNRAVGVLDRRLAHLSRLVRDNPAQATRVDQAGRLSRMKLAEVKSTITALQIEGFAAARTLVASDDGKRTMDSLRTVIAAMRSDEDALLKARADAMHTTERSVFIVVGASIALALLARLAAFGMQVRARSRKRLRRLG